MSSSEWREVNLGEVCEIIGGGTPKTSAQEYWNGEIPWLSVVDFNSDTRHVFNTEKAITINGLNNSSTRMLNKGDIIISARGTVGALAQLAIPMAFNQSCYGLRAKKDSTNDFIYYSIKNILKEIRSKTHGSVFNTITRDTFNILNILLPNIAEQKAIAATLSCLDDMIELNNRTNKVLEEMAQAIFKRWFVDFEFPNQDGEPYKSSGGEMVDSEPGDIPKGWRVIGLGDIGKFIKGKKPKDLLRARTNKNQEPYLTIDALNSGNPQFADRDKMIIADEYDVLMVMDGASSGTVYFGMNGIIGSTISKFDVNNRKLREIVYQFLKVNEWETKTHNTGSAIPHADKSYVLKSQIAVPGENDLSKVSATFELIRGTIMNSRKQNQILTAIRDTLLPKLMSGEIRVPLGEVV